MDKQHFFAPYPADMSAFGIMSESDPFSESQRSKSKEHNDRLTASEIFQKTEKNEEITS